ncbi:bifunctional homocysteine S-methyltransferase/methylenetetrahydrofolate reductase [Bacillus marinisedimentorum]|uniref:bifunctional homocysteine S-methyltransferase/methylenetetrahydrofolate reductase n=1 Tax=Bacillus marinisedimentorum TaxID=1821260 RepID=UPI0008731173|nr:bifunctional homocysteine S-methyltransferase/methylenetetrahydrofolate reductase [Bacillus marinisedimentorum]
MGFLKDLQDGILIGDGAMGTLLYTNGISTCFEELNVTKPDDVLNVHKAYVNAGANVIQTNTYGANRIKLARYGLEDKVSEINTAAAKLAKQAAGEKAYVLGTIGGLRGIRKSEASLAEIRASFTEQAESLLSEKVDGLLLETYYDFEELTEVVKLARKTTDLPIVAHVSLHEAGRLQNGMRLADAFAELEKLGADVIGLNCRLGPYHMIQALEQVPLPEQAVLSVYPNASLPDFVDGRFVYETETAYFEEAARSFREQGARLIGGCCGTTPEHIEAMADALRGLVPVKHKEVILPETETEPPAHTLIIDRRRRSHLHEAVQSKRSVIVELDPPKHLETESFIEGARALKKAGIDALTMADNSLASPRISNMAAAAILKEQVKVRPLVHVACRDRNLIGTQSHLMGLHMLGIDQILAVTGDPARVGDFPGASSVFDVSSFELIELMKKMNEGYSYSGQPLKERTRFSVAAAFNPNVKYLDRAVDRLRKKARAGADYFISQPVYSEKQLIEVHEAVKDLDEPVYIGIMPLTGARNAEFLHNEVPGIKLSDDIRRRMALTEGDKEKARQEGLAISRSLIDAAYDLFNGIYLITPFMRYDLSVELTEYIHEKDRLKKAEREMTHGR